MANKGYLSNSGLETVLLIIMRVEKGSQYTAGDGIAINSRVISCTAEGALTGRTTIDGVHDIPTDYGVVVCHIDGDMSEDDCTLSLDDPDALVPGLTVHAIVANGGDIPMSIILPNDHDGYWSVNGECALCIPEGEAAEIDIINSDGCIIIDAPRSIMPYEVSPSEAIAGDVCFYDNDRKRKVIARVVDDNGDLFWEDKISCPELCPYSSKRFSWIGIVVVPGSHNVYNDGSCGVVSADWTSSNYLYWGNDSGPTTFADNKYTYYVTYNNDEDFQFTYAAEKIMSNYGALVLLYSKSNLNCVTDSKAWYYYDIDRLIPSPYLLDGGRNPAYTMTAAPKVDLVGDNIVYYSGMSDFNGKEHTAVLCTMADRGLSDWRAASTLTNSAENYYFPAACSCWRYHTDGTEQGDWYLPAAGELGYLCARAVDIDNVAWALIEWYSTASGTMNGYLNWFWSSTEINDGYAWNVIPLYGYVTYSGNKYYDGNYVVAFLRVAPPLT